jgi:hypothetical protein
MIDKPALISNSIGTPNEDRHTIAIYLLAGHAVCLGYV